ncbi:MAG: amidase [Chloroflexi bacterium]|nr:amidase [Chloroflexota bacterium]
MPAPYELTISQATAQIREGTLSPVKLVESCLAQIDRLEPKVQAWVTVDRENALEAARERERQLRQGRPLGLLHGIPVGVKDIFYTKGLKTTAGSPLYANFIPSYDATSVAKLKEAGAIILGKTVTTQFAAGDAGPTRNSWNLEHTPGGSSQGSGAAVGARMCPAALGSQTVGSTLRPASYNGCVGFKATYGRVSRYGVIPLAWSLDHVGIIVRSVEDAARLLQAMAGHDPNDPSSAERPVDDYLSGLSRGTSSPRIGLLRGYFLQECDDETRRHTEAAAQKLAKAGAKVEEINMPASFEMARIAQRIVSNVETASFHEEAMRKDPEAYAPGLRRSIQVGLTIPGSYYLQAQRLRRRFRLDMELVASNFDVLMTPSTPAPAPKGITTTGNAMFQAPWTFTGLPALSIPSGLSQSGLPLGVQLITNPFREAHLLSVGRWCEQSLDVSLFPPLAK